jgi:uncharacterized membrane protein YccC
MAVVLAASVPAPVSAVPERVLGWWLGGCAAVVAALVLWPLREREVLRNTASAALRAFAGLVATAQVDRASARLHERTDDALAQLRTVYSRTTYRPGGPTRRDRALTQLVTELERARLFAANVGHEPVARSPRLPEGHSLVSAVVSVFEASADVLKGGPAPDLNSLEDARNAHRAALGAWAGAQLASGASAESVLEGLEYDHRLLVLSYIALAIGANSAIVAGQDVEPRGLRISNETLVESAPGPTVRRVWRTLVTHLSWTSPLMHNSIRAALGLGVAVLVARLFGLERGYWVVLGTMSVLRSNALATGRTAIQAVAGTVLGFVVGALFALWFAGNTPVLWTALPVVVFLAAYTPSALSFTAGQAAFTVLMVVFLNLLTPAGWEIGLVRVEDLAVGSALGVAIGTLLWPRGARSDFAHTLSRLYRLVAVHLSEAIDLILGRGSVEAVNATRAQVQQAKEKTAESFDQLLREHASGQLAPELAGFMLAAADHAMIGAEGFNLLADMGYVVNDCVSGRQNVESQEAALVASWFMLAERIEGLRAARTVPLSSAELRRAALECLAGWRGESSQRGKAALGVVWTRDWLEQLDTLVRDLEEPAANVAASAAAPWWR